MNAILPVFFFRSIRFVFSYPLAIVVLFLKTIFIRDQTSFSVAVYIVWAFVLNVFGLHLIAKLRFLLYTLSAVALPRLYVQSERERKRNRRRPKCKIVRAYKNYSPKPKWNRIIALNNFFFSLTKLLLKGGGFSVFISIYFNFRCFHFMRLFLFCSIRVYCVFLSDAVCKRFSLHIRANLRKQQP